MTAMNSPRSTFEPLERRALLSAAPHVFDPGSTVAGASLGEWSARWWQWALSVPANQNPVTDTTGQHASVAQPDAPVFFLAGSFTSDPVARNIDLPAGKCVLLPLINMAWVPFPTDPPMTVQEQRDALTGFIGLTTELSATIDENPVGDLFAHHEIDPFENGFDVTLPPDNVLGQEPGDYGPCVADGFWLMLAPLTPGQHTLTFGGLQDFGGGATFEQDITYNVNVVARPSPRAPTATTDGISTVPGRDGAFSRPRVTNRIADLLGAEFADELIA